MKLKTSRGFYLKVMRLQGTSVLRGGTVTTLTGGSFICFRGELGSERDLEGQFLKDKHIFRGH